AALAPQKTVVGRSQRVDGQRHRHQCDQQEHGLVALVWLTQGGDCRNQEEQQARQHHTKQQPAAEDTGGDGPGCAAFSHACIPNWPLSILKNSSPMGSTPCAPFRMYATAFTAFSLSLA